MHIKQDIVVVSNGHDLAELMAWAETLLQSYHHFDVTIVINSNFKPDVNIHAARPYQLLFYPSNRIIEPQLLMVQLIKFMCVKTLYLIIEPELFSPSTLPECDAVFKPIMCQGQCVGMAINREQLMMETAAIPEQINQMRQTFKAPRQ